MSFTAQITADISGFEKGIDQAIKSIEGLQKTVQERLNSIGSSMQSIGGKASIFTGAVAACAVAASAFVKKTGDMASGLLAASVALDSSTNSLQEYKLIGIEAGASADAFANSVKMLTGKLKDAGSDSDRVTKIIKGLGVSLTDSYGSIRKTGDVTDEVIKKLSDMENVSQRNIIASQLFGRSWVDIASVLGLGSERIEALKKQAHDMGVVLGEDSLNAANKFSTSVKRMGLQLTAIKDSFATQLAPLLSETVIPLLEEKLIPAVKKASEWIGSIVKSFNNLSPSVKEAVLVITGIATAIGPVLVGLGGILKLLPLIKLAIAAVTGPVGLVIAAIAAAVFLIIKHWDAIKAYFTTGAGSDTFKSLKALALDLKDKVVSAFNAIKDLVSQIWDRFGKYIVSIFNSSVRNIMNVLDTFMSAIKNVADFLKAVFNGDFKGALDALKSLFTDYFNGIKNFVLNTVSTLSSYLAGFLDAVGLKKWAAGVQSFSDRIAESMTATSEAADNATESAKEQSTAVKTLTNTLIDLNNSQADVFKDGSNVYELVRRTSGEITVLTQRLEGLRNGTVAVKDVHSEIEKAEKKVKDLSSALNTLTGDRKLTIKMQVESGTKAWNESDLFKGMKEIKIIPKMDTSSFTEYMQNVSHIIKESGKIMVTPKIDTSLIKDSMGKVKKLSSDLINIARDFNDTIANSISGGMQKIIEGVMSVEGINVGSILGALLAPFGDLAIRLGEIAIATGIGIGAIKKAFESLNPYVAIAAGVALIALGSTIKGAVSSMGKNMGSGTSGYSGGTSSYNNISTPGSSEYRGPYQDDFVVEFKIGNDALIGTLDTAQQRRKRL